MRILYDISLLGRATRGPLFRSGLSRAAAGLGRALIDSDGCRVGLHAGRFRREAGEWAASTPPFDRCRFEAVGGGWPADHDPYDVFHTPFYDAPDEIRAAGGDAGLVFQTFFDLIPLLFPQMCTPEQRRAAARRVAALRPTDWLIAVSAATKNDLCDVLDLDPRRIFIIHLAADSGRFSPSTDPGAMARIRGAYGIPEESRYLLGLSSLVPHKNLPHLVRCFGALASSEPALADLHLVLAGHEGPSDAGIRREIEALDGSCRGRVVLTGFVAEADLAPLYSGALAFVFPSLYEGFGLPPLEAMSCGTPVIASRVASLPEVVGTAGILVDPDDRDALCQAVLELATRPTHRAVVSRRAREQASRFSWERCAAETVGAYRTALANR